MKVHVESVEWDDDNIEHAPRHGVSMAEIEQAIDNATAVRRNKRHESGDARLDSVTDGGRKVVVIVSYDRVRRSLRPITAWEA